MSQLDEVFQCGYCGKYAPLSEAAVTWVEADRRGWTEDGEYQEQIVFTIALTDNPYCGQQLAATAYRVGTH